MNQKIEFPQEMELTKEEEDSLSYSLHRIIQLITWFLGGAVIGGLIALIVTY